jgi:hypothetical protein
MDKIMAQCAGGWRLHPAPGTGHPELAAKKRRPLAKAAANFLSQIPQPVRCLGHPRSLAAVLLHPLLLLLQVIVEFLLLIVAEQIADLAVAGLVDAPHFAHFILAGCR